MELVWDGKALVGEGPAWDARDGTLLFVDIEGRTVYRLDPRTGAVDRWDVGDYVGAVVPRRAGGVVITLSDGFYHLDLATGRRHRLAAVEADRPENRFNDGKCDPQGRFWAGTLHLAERDPLGTLYCLEPDLTVRPVLSQVTISNGLGWSPDGSIMYFIDTAIRAVSAFDFDAETGAIRNRRPVIAIQEGGPDGMAVDQEGMVWVAHWGGSRISRFDPGTGRRLQAWHLPVSQVTSLTFGGKDWQDVYVTSARRGLGPDDLAREPAAGGLFHFRSDTPGLPTEPFAG